MATITKLQVDVNNSRLLVSAKSSSHDDNTYDYRFTKIYVEGDRTFISRSEPSEDTMSFELSVDDAPMNGDLSNYEIPFDATGISDVPNSIVFVWIEETSYEGGIAREPILYFGVTLSVSTFYRMLVDRINIIDCKCVDSVDVDFMLAWHGFNLSKSLQMYTQMIDYWRILHRVKQPIKCEHHG